MFSQAEIVERNRLMQRAVRGELEVKLGDTLIQSALAHYTLDHCAANTSYHRHPHMELSVLLSGRMCYDCEGEEVMLEGGRNEWILIAPDLVHRRLTLADDSLLFGFALKLKGNAALSRYLAGRMLKLEAQLPGRIEELVCSGAPFRAERLRLQLCGFLLELFSANFPAMLREESEGRGFSDTLELIDHYIEENLTDDITVDGIARNVGVSRRHLYRIFAEKHGLPLKEYIIRRRLERAAAALIGGSLTVKEIAALSGFRNLSYFTRQFRRFFTSTPAVYRKRGG